jgi:glutamine synthetase
MTTLIRYMQEWAGNPANDHEDANCQFEINWRYADAMTSADRHTFFKWMVRTVAETHGLWATFMPKPFAHLTGNGAHYHLSLADANSGANLFLDEGDELGLTPLARWFMGGLLHHARGMSAILAPLVNSYKRLIRGAPRSGATWAPVYVTYGAANARR